MQIDEVVWQVINQGPCSFRIKTLTQNFCRNEHNVTGLCTRSSCPLANSQYATIIENQGVCYLYLKTAERCHTPNKMWEKIPLDKCYAKALTQIDENLQYWNKFMVHKCKQRLTKLRQMLNRIRKLKLKGMPELVPIKKKTERREKIREKKAEIAANVETQIEQELLERLKEGIYGDIYNYNKKAFDKVVGPQEMESEDESTKEMDLDSENENFDDSEFIYDANDLEDENEEASEGMIEEDTLQDMEDFMGSEPAENITKDLKKRKGYPLEGNMYGNDATKKKKIQKPRVEIEYEEATGKETMKETNTEW